MISQVSEKTMHRVRWVLTVAWGILILSLFYDPFSAVLTDPSNLASPLRLDPESCVRVQGACLEEQPYALGAPIFWGMVVPSAIFILLVFGHEFWRRICPLSFISQIPRALGWERKRKKENKKTGKVRFELVKVDRKSWLAKNRFLVQFGLFFLGLCNRILFVNSNRIALGVFLSVTAIAALVTGFLYGGKTWCQYICPMAPVQKIYGEPRGLMNSAPHVGDRQRISQSMCRVVDEKGNESSACVACSTPCIDIDAERAYWDSVDDPEKQWLYYGYTGLAVGYFVYYYLYSGSWNYYLSGAWAHEKNQIAKAFGSGFYWFGQAVEIPKIVAAPITLAVFMVVGVAVGRGLENRYKAFRMRQGKPVTATVARHRIFSFSTVFIFNFFFAFAGKNWVALLPAPLPYLIPIAFAALSGLWLYRTWYRNSEVYLRESLAGKLQKQLRKSKLDLPRFLEGRSLDSLTADETYVLAKVLPDFSQEKRLQTYKSMLRDAIDEGYINPEKSLDGFIKIRQEFDISDKDHDRILTDLGQEYPYV
ncbi:MAG: 4Fe-4S binding protein [Cyanobacteria bacterium P01_D01_bin.73]